MPRPMMSSPKRPRLSVDVSPALRRRLRLAAAQRDLTVRQYLVQALEERLSEDLRGEGEDALPSIAKTDPVLADFMGQPERRPR